MKREEIQSKKDLYLFEIQGSAKGFFIYSAIAFFVSLTLANYRLWLPLAVLFFSYIIGIFSGLDFSSYNHYSKLFEEEFENKK